jgi:hypothetical protein
MLMTNSPDAGQPTSNSKECKGSMLLMCIPTYDIAAAKGLRDALAGCPVWTAMIFRDDPRFTSEREVTPVVTAHKTHGRSGFSPAFAHARISGVTIGGDVLSTLGAKTRRRSARMTAKESNDDFGLVFQVHDENLLSVRRFDRVLAVGRLAQWKSSSF